MQGRQQRRAVAAGGDVAPAQVGYGGDAGTFGDAVAVADLPGEGNLRTRAMAHRLSVRADRAYLRGRDAGGIEQGHGGVGERDRHLRVERAQFIQTVAFTALPERDQARAQRRFPRDRDAVQEVAVARVGVVEFDQRSVDAVCAGARDQAKIERSHPAIVEPSHARLIAAM